MIVKKNIWLSVALTLFLVSCSVSSVDTDPAVVKESVEKVCLTARTELESDSKFSQIVIKQCEMQTNNDGETGFILGLNNYLEWGLLESQTVEDIIYTIPLGLLAMSFAKSGVDPLLFDRLLFVSNDADQTVYDIKPGDLREVLVIEDEAEGKQALIDLRGKMEITSLR